MPKKISYEQLKDQHLAVLEDLRTPSGLFRASKSSVNTGYDKAWLRDNFYECLPFVVLGEWGVVKETYQALLKIFLKHEYKIDHAIESKPDAKYKYIHARYHPETFDEFWEEWGNKQNDAVGAILYMVGELEAVHNLGLFTGKNAHDNLRITQKLIDYLYSLEYWTDVDSGIWEEDEEVHASSVGACLAGLMSVSRIDGIEVDQEMIIQGKKALDNLLPRESEKKYVDLALLSLIYPYDVVTKTQAQDILENVEYHLVKDLGVIRYKNDYYYNRNPDGYSEEAEWCFGFSWLAIIYILWGDKKRAKEFMEKAFLTINLNGEIPELYFSNTDEYNENSPLGWAEAMFVVALHLYQEKGYRL